MHAKPGVQSEGWEASDRLLAHSIAPLAGQGGRGQAGQAAGSPAVSLVAGLQGTWHVKCCPGAKRSLPCVRVPLPGPLRVPACVPRASCFPTASSSRQGRAAGMGRAISPLRRARHFDSQNLQAGGQSVVPVSCGAGGTGRCAGPPLPAEPRCRRKGGWPCAGLPSPCSSSPFGGEGVSPS